MKKKKKISMIDFLGTKGDNKKREKRKKKLPNTHFVSHNIPDQTYKQKLDFQFAWFSR